jgi:hypothetical protein
MVNEGTKLQDSNGSVEKKSKPGAGLCHSTLMSGSDKLAGVSIDFIKESTCTLSLTQDITKNIKK